MAVHLPLTIEAQYEASNLMVTSKNMLNPSNGEPIVAPSQDMILGCYYLTKIDIGEPTLAFASGDDALAAYENNIITLHTPVKIRVDNTLIDTTYGRYLLMRYFLKNSNSSMKPLERVLQKDSFSFI